MAGLSDDDVFGTSQAPPSGTQGLSDDAVFGSAPTQPSTQKANALSSQSTSPLAAVTGYGSNISKELGLSDLGSAIAAEAGAGQGSTAQERYTNLQGAQSAMQQAGQQFYPNPTKLGQTSADIAKYGPMVDAAAGVASAGIKGAQAGIESGIAATQDAAAVANPSQLTGTQLRDISGRVFNKADTLGGNLPATDPLVDAIQNVAQRTPEEEALFGQHPLTAMANGAETLRGKPLTFEGTAGIDKTLTGMINDEILPNGKLSSHGQQLTGIQGQLRDMMSAPVEGEGAGFDTQRQAQALWAQSARMNDIEDIMNKASYSDNEVTALKNGFKAYVNNPTKMRGITDPDEVAALQNAARTGIATDVMKTFGSRLIPILSTGTGGALDMLGAEAGSAALRSGAAALQRGRANDALSLIRNRNELPVLEEPYSTSGKSSPKTYPRRSDAPLTGSEGTPTDYGPFTGKPNSTSRPSDMPQLSSEGTPTDYDTQSIPAGQYGIDRMYRARGGRAHSGPVFTKPKSYPALSKGKK